MRMNGPAKLIAMLVLLMAAVPTGVARGNIYTVSATGPATASLDFSGDLSWPNSYGSPFPGSVVTANLSGAGSSTLSLSYNKSFDYDPWHADRLILNLHNGGSQALEGVSLLLTNSYAGSQFYFGDAFTPGLGDYNAAASPWPTFTYTDYYAAGSNPRITLTANSISFIFASPLQAGRRFRRTCRSFISTPMVARSISRSPSYPNRRHLPSQDSERSSDLATGAAATPRTPLMHRGLRASRV